MTMYVGEMITPEQGTSRRFTAWPLWGTAAGALGFVATVIADTRAGEPRNPDYTVTAADMAGLEHHMFRLGGLLGYLTVACLVVFVALWRRRVEQRFSWSAGASVVAIGTTVTTAALLLAYGWKGALGLYSPGAPEAGAYDSEGLYGYYILNDFSPYLSWFGVTIAAGGLAWMAFREGLVSKGLGAASAVVAVGLLVAVAVTGVPGLPALSSLGLLVAGIWLAFGRSPITRSDAELEGLVSR